MTAVIYLVFIALGLTEGTGAAQGWDRSVEVVEKVVIDPGHGGQDFGVVGPSGLKESHLTLALARQLKVGLEEDLGVQVFLTRDDDSDPDLFARTAAVNRLRAQLFISLHAGGAEQRTISGYSVYYQDYSLQKGLSDRVSLTGSAQERPVPWALAQMRFIIPSRRLAGELSQALSQVLRIRDQGATGLPLTVLAGAARPAVLIEVGYLTNPSEEKRLKSQPYRDVVVRGLVQGLQAYQNWVRKRLQD